MGAKKHSSKWYYDRNAASKASKYEYDKDKQKDKSYVKKRVEANRANRKAGTYGNGDGKDYDHKRNKMVAASNNRTDNNLYSGTNDGSSVKGYKMKTRNGKNNAKAV